MKIMVEKDGQVRLPSKYIDRYEMETGAEIYLEPTEEGIILRRPMSEVNTNATSCAGCLWTQDIIRCP